MFTLCSAMYFFPQKQLLFILFFFFFFCFLLCKVREDHPKLLERWHRVYMQLNAPDIRLAFSHQLSHTIYASCHILIKESKIKTNNFNNPKKFKDIPVRSELYPPSTVVLTFVSVDKRGGAGEV